jgi:hypothetical protein
MYVNVTGHSPSVANEALRLTSGSGTQAPARPVASADGAPSLAVPPPEPPRRAWFDLNGDGRIQDWGTLYGGDAYLTWRPPGGAATAGVRPAAREARSTSAPPPTQTAAAELRQARVAYARYGSIDTDPYAA